MRIKAGKIKIKALEYKAVCFVYCYQESTSGARYIKKRHSVTLRAKSREVRTPGRNQCPIALCQGLLAWLHRVNRWL